MFFPSFLFPSWCPHCQHFKPKYIELSNKLYDLAKQLDTKVEVFAVSCVPNKDLCKDQHIKGYPTTRFFPPHSINATEVNAWKLHPHDVMRMVGVSVQQQGGGGDAKTPTVVSAAIQDNNSLRRQQEKEKGGKTPHFMYRSKRQVFDDAHLSFEFAMKTAIFTSPGPLSEKVRNVLKLFLENLQKTLPITSSIQPVINDLVQNFDSVAEDDANLHAILEKHPSPTKTWSPAATQHGTGYTNGLWTLFHIMSVGFVVWNHGAIDQSQKLIPSKVADNVRDYVEHFFQCEVCRLHFLSEYDSCSFDRCNRLATNQRGNLHQDIQFPLWLYETHNAVNVRLRGERIKLHDEPEWLTTEAEVMWPSDKSCPTCWISEGRWDESHIFQFLYNYYWYVPFHGA
jgi:thiol-disulfide isomerase/thioredoxin